VNRRRQTEAKLRENYATLQAMMKYYPEGLTIAGAPDVNMVNNLRKPTPFPWVSRQTPMEDMGG
jgi:hypothetical protein